MNEKQLRQKFIDVATSYLGAKEGSVQHKKIVDTYNKITPLPAGYKVKYTDAWCATFVSTCASMCDLLDIIPAECGCGRMIDLAKKMSIWVENDAYVPKTGDILMYDWQDNGSGDNTGSSDHVGIVVSVSNGKIKVIEGNMNDAVGYRTISVNGKYIRGYICPKFASKSNNKEADSDKQDTSNKGEFSVDLKVLAKGSKGRQVEALQALLLGFGYSLPKYGIDGSYGDETIKAVKKFQSDNKLVVDGKAGPATWKVLLLG